MNRRSKPDDCGLLTCLGPPPRPGRAAVFPKHHDDHGQDHGRVNRGDDPLDRLHPDPRPHWREVQDEPRGFSNPLTTASKPPVRAISLGSSRSRSPESNTTFDGGCCGPKRVGAPPGQDPAAGGSGSGTTVAAKRPPSSRSQACAFAGAASGLRSGRAPAGGNAPYSRPGRAPCERRGGLRRRESIGLAPPRRAGAAPCVA